MSRLRPNFKWRHSRLGVIMPMALILCAALTPLGFSSQLQSGSTKRVRHEIPYHDGTVVLVTDFLEKIPGTQRYRAEGDVQITFQDYVVTGDVAEYDEQTREGFVAGQARFSQRQAWLTCSRAEFNFDTQTGVFYDASGFTDREFYIRSRTIHKTGKDTYRAESGMLTACPEERPKWSFTASQAQIRVDRTARLRNAVFKVKNVPVLYIPYVVLPMEKKARSSGLVPFHTGSSTSKGRVFREGYYQTLGRSADFMVYGDYFSLRGLAVGGIFRTRPNPNTHFWLQVYGIKDQLDKGGIQFAVNGESRLNDEWRAVVEANIASNFSFRQAFSDSFSSATPENKPVFS